MKNLSWPQADHVATVYGRPVRREGWTRWTIYSGDVYLYFSLVPDADVTTPAGEEPRYHVVYNSEMYVDDWTANDWTDEDWNTGVPVPPPVYIPPIPPPWGGPGNPPGLPSAGGGMPGTPERNPELGPGPGQPHPPGGGGGSTGNGGGSGGGPGGGFPGGGTGGGGGGGSATYPGRDPHPEDPPTPPPPVVVSLSITLNPTPDHDYPIYYEPPGPPDGAIVPPAGRFPTDPDDVIGAHVLCWSDLGYPTEGELIGTVTVSGGRPGTANGTIRDASGSIHVYTMGVPGSYSFSIPVPYSPATYYARVGMPGEHPLDPSVDVNSNTITVTTYPRCSDIGF